MLPYLTFVDPMDISDFPDSIALEKNALSSFTARSMTTRDLWKRSAVRSPHSAAALAMAIRFSGDTPGNMDSWLGDTT